MSDVSANISYGSHIHRVGGLEGGIEDKFFGRPRTTRVQIQIIDQVVAFPFYLSSTLYDMPPKHCLVSL